jgi:hypothetical protein
MKWKNVVEKAKTFNKRSAWWKREEVQSQAGHEPDHSVPPSAEVKNEQNYTFTLPYICTCTYSCIFISVYIQFSYYERKYTYLLHSQLC